MSARAVVLAALLAIACLPGAAACAEPDFPPPSVRVWQMGLLREDRLQHASLAMTGGLSVGLITREPFAAAGSALAMGLFKELWDARSEGFDWLDLAADAMGAGASAAATHVLTP